MSHPADRNPFEVLRLDPSATRDEAVAQAARLRRRATTEEEVTAIRQAAQALTGSVEEQFLHALFTHPRPGHESSGLERLRVVLRRHRETGAGTSCPPLDLEEVAGLLRLVLGERWEPPPQAPEVGEDREPAAEEGMDSEERFRRLVKEYLP